METLASFCPHLGPDMLVLKLQREIHPLSGFACSLHWLVPAWVPSESNDEWEGCADPGASKAPPRYIGLFPSFTEDTSGTSGKCPAPQEAEYCSLVPSRVQNTQNLGTHGCEMESTGAELWVGQECEGDTGHLTSALIQSTVFRRGVTCHCLSGQPKALLSPLSHLQGWPKQQMEASDSPPHSQVTESEHLEAEAW